MANTPFDFINSILDKKKLLFDKNCSSYVLTLHFSQHEKTISYAQEINKNLFTLPPEAVYNYLYDKIPKGKLWIKWPKKQKEIQKSLKSLMDEYNISEDEAKHFIKLI